jgi:S-sulfo-L-cysteine synthase (O-acetyl-L-serine-dependent)
MPPPDLRDRIGDTPLLGVPDGLVALPPRVRLLLKDESRNPGGSVKDRAAREMVRDAEASGRLRPGGTILDASSGNTGIAYARLAADRGYRLVLCLPKNASAERQRLLAAYGATVVATSPLEGTDGAQRRAVELAAEHPDWVYLNQYDNPANARAHERTTGPEIWAATGGAVTHFVATVGTGGTIVGTSRFLRSRDPRVQVIEVQPDGPFHGLEGVKHLATARVPGIYDPHAADAHATVRTEDAWRTVRSFARRGLLLGPSGGAAAWTAIQVARALEEGVVVAILPDSGHRYLSETRLWEADPEEAAWRLAS